VIERLLFRHIFMTLIGRRSLRRTKALGLQGILIVIQQSLIQTVNCRRVRLGVKPWFADGIQRLRICGEVMVKGDVLLKYDDDIADRIGCPTAGWFAVFSGKARVVECYHSRYRNRKGLEKRFHSIVSSWFVSVR
jgi:hypothetical protein